jgi:hypothetical protein
VIDTYDRDRLENITNINPNGTHDTQAGTITWDLGTIMANQTRTLSFDATIAKAVNGTIIVNTAVITADEIPPRTVSVQFPVRITPPVTPRSGGATTFFLTAVGIIAFGAGVYYYSKYNKMSISFVPKRKTEIDLGAKKK